jgi:hypothetical protein
MVNMNTTNKLMMPTISQPMSVTSRRNIEKAHGDQLAVRPGSVKILFSDDLIARFPMPVVCRESPTNDCLAVQFGR